MFCCIKELKDVSVSLKEDIMEFRQCLEESVGEAIDKKLEVDGGKYFVENSYHGGSMIQFWLYCICIH